MDGSLVFIEYVFWVATLNLVSILVFGLIPYLLGSGTVYLLGLDRELEAGIIGKALILLIGSVILLLTQPPPPSLDNITLFTYNNPLTKMFPSTPTKIFVPLHPFQIYQGISCNGLWTCDSSIYWIYPTRAHSGNWIHHRESGVTINP